MISIGIKGSSVASTMLAAIPKQASRAAETALDQTAKAIRDEIKTTMQSVFDRPTPYTLNSLKVTPTRNHNMQASVWFKDPERMSQHYLVPQVEGGPRKSKGFELGLGAMMVPGKGVNLDRYGNVSAGLIRQVMSVLGKAETSAGYSANLTAGSAKKNRKDRDYVLINQRRGRLLPGVYQRVQTGIGFGAKTKKSLPFGTYQKGRTRGRFASVVRARGLKPILIEGKQRAAIKPLLPFYTIAHQVYTRRFEPLFWSNLNRFLSR